jgi:glyoxylase-like metal-dependent hydrolase (beta-lactamase superfamily II)
VLKGTLCAFASWTSVGVLSAQPAVGGVSRLTDRMTIVDGGGSNALAFFTGDGFVLVDGGAAQSFDRIMASLGANARVNTLFNTHHHVDQTGNNELFSTGTQETPPGRSGGTQATPLGRPAQAGRPASAGSSRRMTTRPSGRTTIIAHKRTLEWMSADHWIPADDRYEKARPTVARPTETFLTTGSLTAGGERIDYGYLTLAHTNGDIYVHFRDANVLAVGDVASPLRDPALDYLTGAWIGGRVDSMDVLLTLANEQTRIVPAYGPILSKAEFKAERDMMEEVRRRLFDHVREGDSPRDMLERGVLKGLARTWNDPYTFLYDAAKGLWAHHDKLGPNVV